MIAYVLPGVGIYGGIKVGVRFVDALRAAGVPAVVATPGGEAPTWFASSAPIVARERVLAELTEADTVLFSLPHDHGVLRSTGARLIFHCQGTDPLIDPVIADPDVIVLTCWEQARRYVRERTGRVPLDVGISVGDEFYRRTVSRVPGSVSYMSRRGAVSLMESVALPPDTVVRVIDNASESQVAGIMASSDVFVAIAEGEWFGLPALEAMASGCAVVSLPTVGGGYLADGDNCLVVEPGRLGLRLSEILENPGLRERLRRGGVATAQRHRGADQAALLRRLLASEELDLTPCR